MIKKIIAAAGVFAALTVSAFAASPIAQEMFENAPKSGNYRILEQPICFPTAQMSLSDMIRNRGEEIVEQVVHVQNGTFTLAFNAENMTFSVYGTSPDRTISCLFEVGEIPNT